MTMNDTLAAALCTVMNAEKIGRKECVVKPVSKVTKAVFDIMNTEGYLGKYEVVDDDKGGMLKINLLGSINKCGVIKPRFSVKKDNYEKFEKRYLPSKDFGIIIVSTPKGIMTHIQAKEKGLGGRLLAYVY